MNEKMSDMKEQEKQYIPGAANHWIMGGVLILVGSIATTAAGAWISTLLSGPPASSRQTLVPGSSDRRAASAQPAEPAPEMT